MSRRRLLIIVDPDNTREERFPQLPEKSHSHKKANRSGPHIHTSIASERPCAGASMNRELVARRLRVRWAGLQSTVAVGPQLSGSSPT
jgi:hypothetical protein